MSEPSGPDRVREAIARDRGLYAPATPVQLCGPTPESGMLYVPAELLPEDPSRADALLDDLRRNLSCRVEIVYRADWQRPVRPVNRVRRLGNWLVAPLARLMGF